MASGDVVVCVLEVMLPGASAATADTRSGGSTPAEAVTVWDFDDTTAEYMDFKCVLDPGYDGGGLTFTLPWSASSATSGNCKWDLAIRRMQDDAEDIDESHSYQFNAATDTAPSASGEVVYPTIAFTDGADMDSWADGEVAIVRVHRDYDHEDDDMTGDAELWSLSGVET